jgi:mannose-6-phosphate isomerase
MVSAGRFEELLLRRPVSVGDFVYVPERTVHAVGPGLLVCEVQQSSDTTYRVWDWDRTGADGRSRELHLDKALQVMTAPYDPAVTETALPPVDVTGGRRQELVKGQHFEVTLHQVSGAGYRVTLPGYEVCSVLDGSGVVRWGGDEHPLRAGDHLVIPADAQEVELDGRLTVLCSRPAAGG